MEKTSLFGALALKLSPHPENMATEALLFLLQAYPSAWPTVRTYLSRMSRTVPEILVFRSQQWRQELAQPDLLGTDGDGDLRLIVEAKFWAGLTENQPVAYAKGLPQDKDGILLFVCPEMRVRALMDKLQSRLHDAGLDTGPCCDIEQGFTFCTIGTDHALAVVGWRQITGAISRTAESEDDASLLSDISQLAGLCDRMDAQAFLPLLSKHLGPDVARRIQHFADLVDDVVLEISRSHGADTQGLTTGGRQSSYGRYFRFSNLVMFFQYSPKLWSRHGDTPFWLRVRDSNAAAWTAPAWILKGFDCLSPVRYRRATDDDGLPAIGLEVLTGSERDELVADLITQIKEIATAVNGARG